MRIAMDGREHYGRKREAYESCGREKERENYSCYESNWELLRVIAIMRGRERKREHDSGKHILYFIKKLSNRFFNF